MRWILSRKDEYIAPTTHQLAVFIVSELPWPSHRTATWMLKFHHSKCVHLTCKSCRRTQHHFPEGKTCFPFNPHALAGMSALSLFQTITPLHSSCWTNTSQSFILTLRCCHRICSLSNLKAAKAFACTTMIELVSHIFQQHSFLRRSTCQVGCTWMFGIWLYYTRSDSSETLFRLLQPYPYSKYLRFFGKRHFQNGLVWVYAPCRSMILLKMQE